jgi:predicted PurR-regulated permease PerM
VKVLAMEHPAQKTNGWAVAATLAVLALFAYYLRYLLLPFVFAAALAYIAKPLLVWLRTRLRLPHLAAVLLVYAVYLVLVGAFGYWIGGRAVAEARQLLSDPHGDLHGIIARLFGGEEVRLLGRTFQARDLADQFLDGLGRWAGSPTNALEAARLASELVTGLFLALVLLFYFLLHGSRLADGALWLVPPPRRSLVRSLAERVDPLLGRYIRGLLIILVFTSAVSWVGIALLLRIPHAVALAVATGVLELVPVFGPLAAAILVGLLAVEQGSIWTVLAFIVFFTALRLLIDQLVGPLVLGKAARLHPVVILLSFLAGGVLFGPLGLLLAVPVAATVKIVLDVCYRQLEGPAEEV